MSTLPPGLQQLLNAMNVKYLDGFELLSEKESKARLKELYNTRLDDTRFSNSEQSWRILRHGFYKRFGSTAIEIFCNILSQELAIHGYPYAKHIADGYKIREYPLYKGSGTFHQRLWRAMRQHVGLPVENNIDNKRWVKFQFEQIFSNNLLHLYLEPERRAIEENGWISDEDSEGKIMELYELFPKDILESEKTQFRDYPDTEDGRKLSFRRFLVQVLRESKMYTGERRNGENRLVGTPDIWIWQSVKPLICEPELQDRISPSKLDDFISHEVKEAIQAIELKAFMQYCAFLIYPPVPNNFNDPEFISAYRKAIEDPHLKYYKSKDDHGPTAFNTPSKEVTPQYVWDVITVEYIREINNEFDAARNNHGGYEIIPRDIFVRRATSVLQGFVKRREEIVQQKAGLLINKATRAGQLTPLAKSGTEQSNGQAVESSHGSGIISQKRKEWEDACQYIRECQDQLAAKEGTPDAILNKRRGIFPSDEINAARHAVDDARAAADFKGRVYNKYLAAQERAASRGEFTDEEIQNEFYRGQLHEATNTPLPPMAGGAPVEDMVLRPSVPAPHKQRRSNQYSQEIWDEINSVEKGKRDAKINEISDRIGKTFAAVRIFYYNPPKYINVNRKKS